MRTGRGPRVGPTHDPTSPLCESWTDGGQASRAEQGAEGHAEPLISKSQLGGPGGPAEDRFGLLTLPSPRLEVTFAQGRRAFSSFVSSPFVLGSRAVSKSWTHRSRKIRIVS